MQTFGDLANFNPHLHTLAADGVFATDRTFIACPPVPEALLAEDFRGAVLAFLVKERLRNAQSGQVRQFIHVVKYPPL